MQYMYTFLILNYKLVIAQHTCSRITQLSASHIGISNGPGVITDGAPHIVQAHLHTTSVWCCPPNQPDITSTASFRREKSKYIQGG